MHDTTSSAKFGETFQLSTQRLPNRSADGQAEGHAYYAAKGCAASRSI